VTNQLDLVPADTGIANHKKSSTTELNGMINDPEGLTFDTAVPVAILMSTDVGIGTTPPGELYFP
jgi:hypothetical protein